MGTAQLACAFGGVYLIACAAATFARGHGTVGPISGYVANPKLLKHAVDDPEIRTIAEHLLADKYSHIYEYIIVDGPWTKPQRTETGALAVDGALFPRFEDTVEYIHSKGLKMGVSISVDDDGRFPGSRGHEAQDAEQFVQWGIDLLLIQGKESEKLLEACQALRAALSAANGSALLALASAGTSDPWRWPNQVVESARTTIDTDATWLSLQQVLDDSVGLSRFASSGHWNDLGLLQVGRGWLLEPSSTPCFGLWAMLKSPLLFGADLAFIPPPSRDILLRQEVIDIQQDPLGVAADRIWKEGPLEIFAGPLAGGDRVVALFNRHTIGVQYPISNITVTWKQLGYPPEENARVRDVYSGEDVAVCNSSYTGAVDLHNILLLRISPTGPKPEYDDWRPWSPDAIPRPLERERETPSPELGHRDPRGYTRGAASHVPLRLE
eukprot:jgi/Botrbrau1/14343/Bobra.0222s0013.1